MMLGPRVMRCALLQLVSLGLPTSFRCLAPLFSCVLLLACDCVGIMHWMLVFGSWFSLVTLREDAGCFFQSPSVVGDGVLGTFLAVAAMWTSLCGLFEAGECDEDRQVLRWRVWLASPNGMC